MSVQPEERQIEEQPEDRGAMTGTKAAPVSDRSAPLFAGEEGDRFRGRWGAIQVAFVDEPRRSVEEASASSAR